MQKTANINVEVGSEEEEEEEMVEANTIEQPTETIDVVESSSTEDQDQEKEDDGLENMSPEELLEFARNERKAKQQVVAHLREKSSKDRPNLDAIDETDIEEEPMDALPDDLDSRIARLVEEKLQEKQNDYTSGANEWLLQQPWATPFLPETPGSDPLYAKLFTEVKRLREDRKVNSIDEYRHLMKLAAVTVTGKADALLQEAPEESATIKYRKSMATSPHTSTGTPTKRHYTKAEIEFALACGHKPEDVYKD